MKCTKKLTLQPLTLVSHQVLTILTCVYLDDMEVLWLPMCVDLLLEKRRTTPLKTPMHMEVQTRYGGQPKRHQQAILAGVYLSWLRNIFLLPLVVWRLMKTSSMENDFSNTLDLFTGNIYSYCIGQLRKPVFCFNIL